MELSVCVVGAGVSGIVSIKECCALGLKVTCFEKSYDYGGLWSYSEATLASEPQFKTSVMKTTILNTHKEVMAFSDFPPPATLPSFMRQKQYMDYMRSYVEANNLLPCIKLQHEVLECKLEYNSEFDSCKWFIRVRDIGQSRELEYWFDKLVVANGHHNVPYVPTFTGQDKFKGLIVHSAFVKNILADPRFIDKRVAVVGIGSSACDVCNDASIVAEKCYLSSNGCWFKSRLASGNPYGTICSTRYEGFKDALYPKSYLKKRYTKKINSEVDHDFFGLRPKHSPIEKKRTIHDLVPYRVMTGGVLLKNPIERFTEKGLVFKGEKEEEYEVDIVVLSTGYVTSLPFIDVKQLGIWSDVFDDYALFMNIFPFQIRVKDKDEPPYCAMSSIAFVGQCQTSGPTSSISELQARYASMVFKGECKLPSIVEMTDSFLTFQVLRSKMGNNHNKHLAVGSFVDICDKIAERIGVKPNLSKLFFKDYKVWRVLVYEANASYQYRLKGPGSWSQARGTILGVRGRIESGVNDGKNHILYENRR